MRIKRKAALIVISLALLVCSGIYLSFRLRSKIHPDYGNHTPLVATTPSSSPPDVLTGSPPAIASETEEERRFVAAFATPISFFGKVVDQHGAPVAMADIKMAANDKALGGKPSEYVLKSDSNGLFSIEGITGLTLSIEVSKPGYHLVPPADNRVTSSAIFDYALSSTRGHHRPTKGSPVLFTLRRPGNMESLQKVKQRNFRIGRDGTPLKVALDTEGRHNIILRCWNSDLERVAGQRQYDWRFEITVMNGGLVPFSGIGTDAPLEGYATSDLIEMPSSLPASQWRGLVERSYFIRFDDQTFARMKLEVHAGGDHFVTWESAYNPQPQSRNLEEPPLPSR